MPDTSSVTTSSSWFSRIGSSIAGIFLGLILIVIAVALLFWNEGRAVKTCQMLVEGEGAVVSVAADAVAPENEGKLVHVSGEAATAQDLADEEFGVAAEALRLRRDVAMYQWEEKKESKTQKKLGGGEETVTTYTYSKAWNSSPVDSSAFHDPAGHENPVEFSYAGATWDAEDATVGAFAIPSQMVAMLGDFEEFAVRQKPEGVEWPEGAWANNGRIFLGANPAQPQVGDLRISFGVVRSGDVSIIARQSGDTFAPYLTKAGGEIEMIRPGRIDARQMFAAAQSENTILTWILRAVGFVMIWVGFSLIFAPLSVLADVLPFLGNLVGAATGMIAFLLAVALAAAVIAVAWIFYRPLLGLFLLVVAAGAVILGIRLVRKKAPPAVAAA